jgi:hypothetical protein
MPETQKRWFTAEQLETMVRPTMDRALEAIDAGDLDAARGLCEAMKSEWRYVHDMLAETILALITFVQEQLGEDAIPDAWGRYMERSWRQDAGVIRELDRRQMVSLLAGSWRAHSTSGTGPHAGAFTIEEDDEKFTFRMDPCGSGQRLVLMGKYEGEGAYGRTERAHDWSFNTRGRPLYCTHCTLMNELLPIRWYGLPLYPTDPPEDYHRDPCTWYWYKDPADIPARFWERYGMQKPAPR